MVPRGPQVHLHLVKCCSGLESMQISPRSLEEHIIKVLSRKISEISKVLNARLSQAARIPDPRTISIVQSGLKCQELAITIRGQQPKTIRRLAISSFPEGMQGKISGVRVKRISLHLQARCPGNSSQETG